MSNALMTVKDLHSHYGMSHVLRGVSLEINSGETIALMGRNGMGKTTLIKCLLGLVPATSGDIIFREQDAKLLSTHLLAKAGIAYVPEGRGIFKNLSVKENLFLAARSGSKPKGSRWAPEEQCDEPRFNLMGRKAIVACDDELEANPRARSAKLRMARRTDAPSGAINFSGLGLPKLSLMSISQ